MESFSCFNHGGDSTPCCACIDVAKAEALAKVVAWLNTRDWGADNGEEFCEGDPDKLVKAIARAIERGAHLKETP